MKKWVTVGLTSLIISCTSAQDTLPEHHAPPPNTPETRATVITPLSPTLYDYRLHAPDHSPISLAALTTALADADVVLVGEWHGHPATHLLQAQLFAALHAINPNITLSMEQFARDNQHTVNQYLAGEIGEVAFIKKAKAWPNYRSDYRPLVEFAKANKLDIIAANAPRAIVRCIGREGATYLHRLPAIERRWVAQSLTLDDDAYRQRFYAAMHHGDDDKNQRQFAAQTSWDDTMAESIVKYLALSPSHQVIHTAGRFHVAEGLGIASRIRARNPDLNIIMVTPVTTQLTLSENAPDYTFTVQPLPASYINEAEMGAVMTTLLHRNQGVICHPSSTQ